jgi:drug/metabolite transporter (DMT)-like permease
MSWLLLATIGQFINAIVAFLDKYIVSDEKALPKPFVYAFYSCLLTGFWIIIYYIPGLHLLGIPTLDNVHKPTIQVIGMSFLAAYTFFMALVSMYEALRKAEAVNVMPVIGAVSAIATMGMSYLFLEFTLSNNFIWGVIVLSLGTLLVAQSIPKRNTVLLLVHSGVFFALHYITMKGLFMETNFDDGLFWSRIGLVLFALSLLMVPAYFDRITEQTKTTSTKAGVLVLLTKILAGIAAFLLLKATHLGDVTVVQALDGLKFVFILLITVLFSTFLPDSITKHEVRPKEVFRKVLYVAIITVGYFILFL